MSDFFSKIEDFLFDILGLVLPGLIFILVLILPAFFLDVPNVPRRMVDSSYLLSGLITVSEVLRKEWNLNANSVIIVVLILSYLLGHLIKVVSIIKYEILTAVFDRTINKMVLYLFEKIKLVINRAVSRSTGKPMYNTWWYEQLKTLFSPVKALISKIFTFKSPDYMPDNNILRTEVIETINRKLNTKFPDKWYSLYKISTIIKSQEDLRSLAGTFLAKYNLYRSLALIFLFTSIYLSAFFNTAHDFMLDNLAKVTQVIILISLLLWFTFNYKFKRYWTLCGNETLVSLYYFLNKKKLNEV